MAIGVIMIGLILITGYNFLNLSRIILEKVNDLDESINSCRIAFVSVILLFLISLALRNEFSNRRTIETSSPV